MRDSLADDLAAYARKMDRALNKGESFFEYNLDIWHASIVVCLAMQYATRHVLILSNELDAKLYGSDWFLEEARRFIGKGGTSLDILVESELPDDHPIWDIVSAGEGRVTIKLVPKSMQEQYKYNFLVADSNGYRFERDRQYPKAIVSFNDNESDLNKGVVEALKKAFAALSHKAKDLPTPAD